MTVANRFLGRFFVAVKNRLLDSFYVEPSVNYAGANPCVLEHQNAKTSKTDGFVGHNTRYSDNCFDSCRFRSCPASSAESSSDCNASGKPVVKSTRNYSCAVVFQNLSSFIFFTAKRKHYLPADWRSIRANCCKCWNFLRWSSIVERNAIWSWSRGIPISSDILASIRTKRCFLQYRDSGVLRKYTPVHDSNGFTSKLTCGYGISCHVRASRQSGWLFLRYALLHFFLAAAASDLSTS